ncbi:Uncharacterised protein r2_g576 [Pycnogonum litorale]
MNYLSSVINDDDYSPEEIQINQDRLQKAMGGLAVKHDEYTELIDNDQEYQEAEKWFVEVETEVERLKHKCHQRMKERSPEPDVHNFQQNNEAGGSIGQNLFKMERPKMPQFDGSIKDYITFKEEFRVFVEPNIHLDTAPMILRNCLGPGPKAAIRGIGMDCKLMWQELDSTYGNARQTSDAILADIEKFKELRTGESKRFIDFVNLIRTSYHILKQIGRPSDIDNNAMLSRIEQKLTYEAKLEWARHLDRNDIDNPTLLDLQEWLSSEKRTQIRIGAAIRSVGSGRINQMSGIKENTNWVNRSSYTENKSTNVKCWMCQTDSHWPDQCSNFNSLTPENRWEKLKKEQACFSCLKKAGRSHNIATCKRRRPCNAEMSNGKKCQQYHHRLLHYSNYNADYRASPTSSQSSTNQDYLQNSAESVPIPVDNSRRNGQSSNLPGVCSGARPKTNNVSLAMVAESPSPLLPVAQVDFIGMNSKEQDSLLFDTGAQLSIIRKG